MQIFAFGDINLGMGKVGKKLPYVIECELFIRKDFKCAEEILAEYNDFYIFNLAQLNSIFHKEECLTDEQREECEMDEAKRLELAEKNAKAATDHFTALFGSKDFSESAMVGFRPAWYDLQQILLEEYKHKTNIAESAINGIAPYLRNVASVMLFAERVVSDFESLGAEPDAIKVIKDGFKLLLEMVEKGEINMPEYHKTKTCFKKYKKPEQYIDFCEKLFAGKAI